MAVSCAIDELLPAAHKSTAARIGDLFMMPLACRVSSRTIRDSRSERTADIGWFRAVG